MTQIITVSAYTAAYAMEALKPLMRVSRAKFVEETARATMKEADTGDEEAKSLIPVDLTTSISAGMSMMSSGDHPPQTSVKQAVDAYRRGGL